MAKIIPFEEYRDKYQDYEQAHAATMEQLEEVSADLIQSAIDLAVAGVWRDWDKDMPEGSVFEFDPEMLLECGDPVVVGVMRVWETLQDVLGSESE